MRVTITDHVRWIQECAFRGCDSLRFIRFPSNLEFIGDEAFSDCTSFESLFLPSTVTRIGSDVFHGCKALRFFNWPDPNEHFGNWVFRGCDRLSTTVRNNLSKVCYSTSVNPQTIQECIDTHGIEIATNVSNQ